jgi:replicative DNA helicase
MKVNDIDVSLHRIPPQNREAEQSILGGILLDNESLHSVLEILQIPDFYSEVIGGFFPRSLISTIEMNPATS